MKYNCENKIVSVVEWNKESPKEILQYAIGSLLYMPAINTKIADEIINKRYPYLKSLVLCLEDSIGDNLVEEGEKSVKAILDKLSHAIKEQNLLINDLPLIFIRVREHGQMKRIYKECSESLENITGFVIPKFDNLNANNYIEEFLEIKSKLNSIIYIMPIIESKTVMYKETRMNTLNEINVILEKIKQDVLCIRVGGTDFCNIYGIRRKVIDTIWDVKVIADCLIDIVNVFARNYIVSGPVWEYFNTDMNKKDWENGLKKELSYDYLNGFIGKTSIHPVQLPIIQESLKVTYENYQDAIKVLEMSDNLIGTQKGFGGNKMNESKMHIKWAKKIINLASIYGVKEKNENMV